MPEERQAPRLEEANLEAEDLKLGVQAVADNYALSLVNQTFYQYESFRTQNHDPRWNVHDALYVGWVPPKTWEGTTTPRSSLGMPITFSQIESAFPAIYQALFVDDQWFQVVPEPGASSPEAQAIQAHLKYAVDHPKDDFTGNTEVELELAIRQLLLHGNGGGEVLYDVKAGHPRFEWRDLRDIYVDPGTPVPSTDAARSMIHRCMLTVDQVDELRHDPRMRIPPKPVLVHMARTAPYAVGDKTKQTSEALRGVSYNPAQWEWAALPSERKIECLVYYSRYRIIWVLNRQWIVYNERNPYGFIPFCFAPCFPIPGRFYAMSYGDVIENPQRYIEALYNGHLDELALALRPPRVRKRGSILTPSQQRWAPGAIQEADEPQKDVALLTTGRATANIMSDVAYLEAAVEKLTGVNGIGVNGVSRPGNQNRTATGISAQAQGGASRLWPIIKHIEDYLIVPMLYKMYRMVQVHSHPGQLLPALGQNDQYMQVGAQVFNQPVRFTIQASSKMLTREKLAQVVPFLTQYIMAGPFIQGIQAVGQTVDFEVFSRMLQDATGTGSMYRLIRPMNQQEVQAKQTPPPQFMLQSQLKQQDAQTRLQLGQMKANTDLQVAQMGQQGDPQAAQMEMMKSIIQMQTERQKAQIEAQKAHQKMMIDHMTAKQKMAHEHQAAQQKMMVDAAMNHQKLQQDRENHVQNLMVQGAQAKQQLQHGAQAGEQKIAQSKALTDHKITLDKEKMKIQSKLAAQKAKTAQNRPAASKTTSK